MGSGHLGRNVKEKRSKGVELCNLHIRRKRTIAWLRRDNGARPE